MTHRIGYLISQYPATSHTFIAREIRALRKQEFDISTFSIRAPTLNERVTKQDQEEYQRTWYVFPVKKHLVVAHLKAISRRPKAYVSTFIDALQHRVYGIKALFMSIAYFGEAIYLADELERQNIVHLHNHFANSSATVGYLATRFLSIPWSLTLHGTADFDYPSGLLLPKKIAHAEFVACASYFMSSQAMRIIDPKLWPKLFINRCGIEIDKFQIKEVRVVKPTIRILCVARLSPEKGLLGLVQAFSKIIEAGINAELRIIGEGDERQNIEQKIQHLNIQHCCQLPGKVSEFEVVDELIQADIFVLSSFMEGLPVSIMEAFALEIPVIAPNVGGISELVEDGVSGLLFSPGNWSQLAEKLMVMCSDQILRDRLTTKAKSCIEDDFDISHAVIPLAKKLNTYIIPSS